MQRAKKSLSQNFLIDKNICKKIINQSNILNKVVLEIGPGYGALTDFILLKNPKKLYLIEKDVNLVKYLKQKFQNNKKIIIIEEDILKYDLNNLNKLIIFSNLPYNISTKIILYLFNYNKNIIEMIFMIQKEVAEKFDYNLPNMNKYKFLTCLVSSFYRLFDVSSGVFFPKPKVQSTVVKFIFNNKDSDLEKGYYFTNLVFKNIRKKIGNNIKIKNSDKIFEKRVNELSINELMHIYNFF
tara:strand:- start:1229 stop:1948 length:720 start_codon:yes stop_codon:yes gene_type:complete